MPKNHWKRPFSTRFGLKSPFFDQKHRHCVGNRCLKIFEPGGLMGIFSFFEKSPGVVEKKTAFFWPFLAIFGPKIAPLPGLFETPKNRPFWRFWGPFLEPQKGLFLALNTKTGPSSRKPEKSEFFSPGFWSDEKNRFLAPPQKSEILDLGVPQSGTLSPGFWSDL